MAVANQILAQIGTLGLLYFRLKSIDQLNYSRYVYYVYSPGGLTSVGGCRGLAPRRFNVALSRALPRKVEPWRSR